MSPEAHHNYPSHSKSIPHNHIYKTEHQKPHASTTKVSQNYHTRLHLGLLSASFNRIKKCILQYYTHMLIASFLLVDYTCKQHSCYMVHKSFVICRKITIASICLAWNSGLLDQYFYSPR